MIRERRRLTLDQGEASSFDKQSLQRVKKNLSENSSFFNARFNFYYDRKLKAIILRAENLTKKSRRYVSLSAAQSMVLRVVQDKISGIKKCVTAADLLEKVSLRKCCFETILGIMKILVKKRILEEEEIQLQDRKISVFKVR